MVRRTPKPHCPKSAKHNDSAATTESAARSSSDTKTGPHVSEGSEASVGATGAGHRRWTSQLCYRDQVLQCKLLRGRSVIMQRQVPTMQKTLEIPQVQFFDQLVDVPDVMQRQVPVIQGEEIRGSHKSGSSTEHHLPILLQRQFPMRIQEFQCCTLTRRRMCLSSSETAAREHLAHSLRETVRTSHEVMVNLASSRASADSVENLGGIRRHELDGVREGSEVSEWWRSTRPTDVKHADRSAVHVPRLRQTGGATAESRRRPLTTCRTLRVTSSVTQTIPTGDAQARTAKMRAGRERRARDNRAEAALAGVSAKSGAVHLCTRCAWNSQASGVWAGHATQSAVTRIVACSLSAATLPRRLSAGGSETLAVQIGAKLNSPVRPGA